MTMIATQEAPIEIAGVTYQLIQLDGRDYYLKSPRPGSSLIEVWCRRPLEAVQTSAPPDASLPAKTKSATRSPAFIERVKEGCAKKDGQPPEHFTYEENPNKSVQASAAMNAPTPTPRPAHSRSFPDGTQPSILPDPVTPTGAFPDRY